MPKKSDMRTVEERLDELCQKTTSAETLSKLHACRPGHPLNNPHQWQNALWAVAGKLAFNGGDVWWLEQQAKREREAA